MNKRVGVYVSGRVQGVFFRAETRGQAGRLGLTGWVRNLPDGRVQAEFQGEEDAIELAVKFCRDGPPHAAVARVEVEALDFVEGERGFVLR
jgi:acylphosphatase